MLQQTRSQSAGHDARKTKGITKKKNCKNLPQFITKKRTVRTYLKVLQKKKCQNLPKQEYHISKSRTLRYGDDTREYRSRP